MSDHDDLPGALLGSVVLLLVLIMLATLASTQVLAATMLQWPVDAPERYDSAAPPYAASGWQIIRPFGWNPDPTDATRYALHEGIDLAGPMFCAGCAVRTQVDADVVHVGWDVPGAPDPNAAGAGVVVTFAVRNVAESGVVANDGTLTSMQLTYGHLEPYRVYVRTRSCVQVVAGACDDDRDDPRGQVTVVCSGLPVTTTDRGARRTYRYATPGPCTASVRWPAPADGGTRYAPDGATTLRFDQRIDVGVRAQDAAITFRAIVIPPPPVTPTLELGPGALTPGGAP